MYKKIKPEESKKNNPERSKARYKQESKEKRKKERDQMSDDAKNNCKRQRLKPKERRDNSPDVDLKKEPAMKLSKDVGSYSSSSKSNIL